MPLTEDELDHLTGSQWQAPLPPICPACGYNMTGLPAPRCPECGRHDSWRKLRQRAFRVWFDVLRLRHANQDAAAGLMFIGIAWPVRFVFWLLEIPLLSPLVGVLAFCMAAASLTLGAQVFVVFRLPQWAREYVTEPPRLDIGVTTALLSVGLLIFSVFA